MYINDIKNSVNKLKLGLYADDSCFYASGPDLNSVINVINEELHELDKWVKANRLTLSYSKSHYILFHRQLNIPDNYSRIRIDNISINEVKQTKFLGIVINYNLKWDTHVNNIVSKINKYSSIFFQVRNYLDRNSFKLIYNSLVYSALTYGNIIWGKTVKRNINKLQVAQKKLVRTIMFRQRRAHTNLDFFSLSFLKINDINNYFAGIFTYKSLNFITEPYNYFQAANNFHPYPLRNNLELRAPFSNSAQGRSSPAIYCCKIWTEIPNEIKNKPSVASFKFALKNFLLNRYVE